MELNKTLEYRICFDKVKNLNEVKKNGNYFGSVEVEGNLYAITVEGKKKRIMEGFVPEFISEFKKTYKAGRVDKGMVFE